jgi:multisubunit Na+/H+ antiporter MnhG subunit
MGIDIRLPIGLMFSVFGLLLTAFGLFSNRSIYARSLGINVNVIWGVVLLVFGLIMFFLGRRGAGSAKSGLPKSEDAGEPVSADVAARSNG